MKNMTKPTDTPLNDAEERKRALDPTQSFIVQAPAGSGKTELLTQRFLVLLSCVKLPEEILAITFTKKSAAEMRDRIVKSLKNASTAPEPESAHAKQTWSLARNALQRNLSLGWNLLDNPNRLQIQTIDSFNASLTRQLPLLSHFGAPLEIIDDATLLYREAVQEFLTHLEENYAWAKAIEKLLLHMDNDLEKVEKLLINMLAKRDQWLAYITLNSGDPELRRRLETHLSHVITDKLTALCECFPIEYGNELVELAQFAATNLLREKPDSPIAKCVDLTDLPGNELEDRAAWLALSKLLLTESGTWRKDINKGQGFPKESDGADQDERKRFSNNKKRMQELLQILNTEEELQQVLIDLNSLPEQRYHDTQWETLDALHEILRVVVAQLKLVFQERTKIDYIENALAANIALGTLEEPTDITLALDYKIQHILIDEFQDNSNSQYRLLEKLISGWQSNDGRSLFVVGDPMQSIYRFREAEVGLFIRARQHGIGHLYLEPLTLSVNFRSIPGVVNWVNESFAKVLPPFEDISSGAVSYSPSIASQTDTNETLPVLLHPFINGDENMEANAIIQLIQTTRATNDKHKIAILVRSRTHLKAIIPALKAANLPFRALDIEPLTTRPIIQDLLALTRALIHPADRIAWLAVLRAPWCGMTLSDLLILAGERGKHILWEQMRSKDILAKLSPDGQKRLKRIFSMLEVTMSQRRRYTLRQWVEYTWLKLGGPACASQHSDLEDAQAYFKLLEKLDDASDLPDFKRLDEAINKLYAAPNNQADDFLQIMTIHNSKGLEFDVVILPHLERKAPQGDKQLLQWMERPRLDDTSDLILAPIQAVGEGKNAIYDYIVNQQRIKTDHESGRLLYVAATRAKKQLHLFFNLKAKEQKSTEIKDPTGNSLLQKLWPAIHADIKSNMPSSTSISEAVINAEMTAKQIRRLTSDWANPLIGNKFVDESGYHQKKSGFYLPQNNPKYIGTLIHQILQQISHHGIDWWQAHTSETQQAYVKKNLLQLGMEASAINESTLTVQKAIVNTLHDSRGQWILLAHLDAQSEMPLTTHSKNLVIDRTFIDEMGIRWIIDYKSSELEGDNLEAFLNAEQKQYKNQLLEYHQALYEIDRRPIKVGLYFPLIPAWREWSFEK